MGRVCVWYVRVPWLVCRRTVSACLFVCSFVCSFVRLFVWEARVFAYGVWCFIISTMVSLGCELCGQYINISTDIPIYIAHLAKRSHDQGQHH